MKYKSGARLNLIGAICSFIVIAIIFQLFRIQNSNEYIKLSEWADEQYTYEKRTVYPERGNIYDRWGHLLAGNEEVYEVGVLLQYVKNAKSIAETLSVIPNVDYETALGTASLQFGDGKNIYGIIADFLPTGVVDALSKIKDEYETLNPEGENPDLPSLRGMVWYPHLQRSYPENTLAANVLGFYKFRDRKNGEGFYGIEEYYNDILSGPPVTVEIPLDPYMIEETPTLPSGASMVLTIDREIQAMVEEKLDEAVEHYKAESATVIVMNPKNGEILAMASQPRINLNQYWIYEEELKDTTPFNRAISETYEPGSVFKILTMAAALDSGKVDLNDKFDVGQYFEYFGSYIYNWNRKSWGQQDVLGCLQNSLNVCLAKIATQIGADTFYSYLQAFGIGRRTNIDLGGEEIWPLSVPEDDGWYPINLATNSFGQGVAVTPIQMATAASAIANGGKMMKPHVVKAIIDNGETYETAPQVLSVPISEKTANTMNELLAKSLEGGEGSLALLDGYRIAGKTGTAEVPVESGYDSSLSNTSFVGWGPVDDPQFLVYVWIEKPDPEIGYWGSYVAAPVFHDIVEELVVMLNIPPDSVRQTLYAAGSENDQIN
ncbi:MAG: peptidoglycan D,D-transpeptidase FtsI family protein [Anaerolineaceae bacterium]